MANPHNLIPELRAFIGTSPYFRPYGEKPFDTGIHIYQTFDSEAYSENNDILHHCPGTSPVLYINTSGLVFQTAKKPYVAVKYASENSNILMFTESSVFMPLLHTYSLKFKIDENGYFRERVYADDTVGKSEQVTRYIARVLGVTVPESYHIHHSDHCRNNLDLNSCTPKVHKFTHKITTHDFTSYNAMFDGIKRHCKCDETETLVKNLDFLTDLLFPFKGIKTFLDLATTDITHMSLNEILNSIEELY